MTENYRRQNVSRDRSSDCLSNNPTSNNRNPAYGSSGDLYNRNSGFGNSPASKFGVRVRNSVSVSSCLNSGGMHERSLAADDSADYVYNGKSAYDMDVCKSRNCSTATGVATCGSLAAINIPTSESQTSRTNRYSVPDWIRSSGNINLSHGESHNQIRSVANGGLPVKDLGGAANHQRHCGIADSVDVLDVVRGTDCGDCKEQGV